MDSATKLVSLWHKKKSLIIAVSGLLIIITIRDSERYVVISL